MSHFALVLKTRFILVVDNAVENVTAVVQNQINFITNREKIQIFTFTVKWELKDANTSKPIICILIPVRITVL